MKKRYGEEENKVILMWKGISQITWRTKIYGEDLNTTVLFHKFHGSINPVKRPNEFRVSTYCSDKFGTNYSNSSEVFEL